MNSHIAQVFLMIAITWTLAMILIAWAWDLSDALAVASIIGATLLVAAVAMWLVVRS